MLLFNQNYLQMKNQVFYLEVIQKEDGRYYVLKDARTGAVLDVTTSASELATFLDSFKF